MRLIDADLLLERIAESRKKNPHGDSKIRANHTIEHDHIAHLVLEQPTAYDVDKVVERLEETLLNLTFHKDNNSKTWNKAIHNAIEIVKSGGIE